MAVYVEILSGPRDGLRKPWPEGQAKVRLANDPDDEDAFLAVDYDPEFPSEGVRLCLQEAGIRVEEGSDSEVRGYEEPICLGQIWLRVCKAAEGDGDMGKEE